MKVLITGGAGFIGSNLVDYLLNKNAEITVLDNFSTGHRENLKLSHRKIKIVDCDLCHKGKWIEEFKKQEFVVHLAALADIVPSIKFPASYFNANVVATMNVLEATKSSGIKKFVYSASSSCYGVPKLFPTPESSPIDPKYPYALTKRLGEELVLHWFSVYDVPAISLRFFNVYGPRAQTRGQYGAVMGVFLAQKRASKPLTIVGTGEQTRDFTYIDDVVESIWASLTEGVAGSIYNIGSGATVSINKIAELIGGETINIPKRPGEPDITFADISLIGAELGWTPKIKIEEGIKKIMGDVDSWLVSPVWEPETIAFETQDWFRLLGKY